MVSPSKSPSSRVLIWFTGMAGALGTKAKPRGFFKELDIGLIVWVEERSPFSWGNNIDIEELCNGIKSLTENRELLFFGNSMGGFLAILLSKYLKPKKVITMNPQYSVSSDIVSEETRWAEFINVITEFKHKDLSNSFISNTDYAIMFGVDDLDEMHFKLFEKHTSLPNVQVIKFLDYKSESSNTAHQAGIYLNSLGLFRPTMSRFYNGQSLKELYAKKSIKTSGVKY